MTRSTKSGPGSCSRSLLTSGLLKFRRLSASAPRRSVICLLAIKTSLSNVECKEARADFNAGLCEQLIELLSELSAREDLIDSAFPRSSDRIGIRMRYETDHFTRMN